MLIEPTAPDTALVGRAAFPKGHRYLRAADELDSLFTDDPFVALFPTHGHTILQFAKDSPIATQPTPCSAESPGCTCSARSSRNLGLMPQLSVNFAPA